MDRTVLRWILIALVVLGFYKFGMPLFSGSSQKAQNIPTELYANAPGFIPDRLDEPPADTHIPWAPVEGDLCKVRGNRFEAELSTRGAAVTHFRLLDDRYARSEADDMSTTPDHERWRSLRTLFRADGADNQIPYDRFNWSLTQISDSECVFTHETAEVRISKTVRSAERPFELEVETTLVNLAPEPRRHRTVIGMYAFRRNSEVKGRLGRVSPFQTELAAAISEDGPSKVPSWLAWLPIGNSEDVTRKSKDDFKDGWFSESSINRYVAISNYYFAQALIPDSADERPAGELLAEDWISNGQGRDDDDAGAVYHARLVYPARSLAHGESATYKQTAFFGPKEREVLAKAADGRGLSGLINLGFFSPVAKVLVGVLLFFHDHVTLGNWGLAIILMTICVRVLLFPLAWKGIKITVGMRKLKPEVDAINAKFRDDAQQKNLALMELYRKHGVNPLGGCLPQLVQMPIWFAMYTTLQTAVEMYHTKFLWFSDLSAPDAFYILPLVLGLFMIIQQRIVPQQGMDPIQQKMMMYVMPAIFTVMMLFLPAALGIYMLTNSVLGILQQLAVESVAPRGPSTDMTITGKGKARV